MPDFFFKQSHNWDFFPAPIRSSCQSHDRSTGSDRENEKCGSRFGQLELPQNEENPDE